MNPLIRLCGLKTSPRPTWSDRPCRRNWQWYVSTAGRRCFDMYAKHRGSSVYHACDADFCQLAASKDKECDGQPPQYAWVQAGKPGKVSDGC